MFLKEKSFLWGWNGRIPESIIIEKRKGKKTDHVWARGEIHIISRLTRILDARFFSSFCQKHHCRLTAVLKLLESCAYFSFSFILGWHFTAISVHKTMKKIVILCCFCFCFCRPCPACVMTRWSSGRNLGYTGPTAWMASQGGGAMGRVPFSLDVLFPAHCFGHWLNLRSPMLHVLWLIALLCSSILVLTCCLVAGLCTCSLVSWLLFSFCFLTCWTSVLFCSSVLYISAALFCVVCSCCKMKWGKAEKVGLWY